MATINGDAKLIVAEAKEEDEATHDGGNVHSWWLRAVVLGASNGLVSTASLMLGISTARPADKRTVLLSRLAGLVTDACNMAIGEYISVHAQLDVELAEIEHRLMLSPLLYWCVVNC
uniref:Vacuolar iron transporter n=1 Tax=Oryza meridionalis TaxID=40149 RepID=A0A0E0C3W6_9ORYZ